jgi:hypothetical protein
MQGMGMDVLKGLALDAWYMVAIGIGAVVLVLALTVPLQFPNGPVALIALGVLLCGVGEWRNHPRQVVLSDTPFGRARMHHFPRVNSRLGNTLDGVGGVLMVAGIGLWLYELLHHAGHG